VEAERWNKSVRAFTAAVSWCRLSQGGSVNIVVQVAFAGGALITFEFDFDGFWAVMGLGESGDGLHHAGKRGHGIRWAPGYVKMKIWPEDGNGTKLLRPPARTLVVISTSGKG
jgi:hypothetical protein